MTAALNKSVLPPDVKIVPYYDRTELIQETTNTVERNLLRGMEYLEGETLASRLINGPLPVDQVLRYAIEIVNALDHAHRRGIVHRDLKPSNVMSLFPPRG